MSGYFWREGEPPCSRVSTPKVSSRRVTGVAATATPPASFPASSPPRQKPRPLPRFVISPHSRAFRRRFFPEASDAEWNDWRWQLRQRIRDLAGLERLLRLSEDERQAILRHRGTLPLGITPYYASLLDAEDPQQPLRRTVVPVSAEYLRLPGEADDPLAEDAHSPVPGIVHRYPDRVLFLVTGFCPVYCRYCTRSRLVGDPGGAYRFSVSQWEQALAYIEATPAVRDVLLSGGDPLTLSDERLAWLLARLRRIRHVELVRLGTKVPAVLPQRITPALTRLLRRFHPLWLSLHFTHPDELTPEVRQACARLADAGIPLGSQTVLLAGINDDVATLRRLFQGLLTFRVRPYYLYQCDPISGSGHFRTPVARGLELIRGLRGHTTGYAVPTFVIDAPGGGGKVPLQPEAIVGRDGNDLLLRNYEGRLYRYPDPLGGPGA
ncbi:MAG: L-lysine 2,3-aminomutase [Candidatus Tectimicrobiota bacterium]|nr:MAG: L-lysine 2,3-aminomutase [Candidatus Tectomicrobia bacterium]